jgi:MFS family permease
MKPQAIQFLYNGATLASVTFIPLYGKEVLGLTNMQIGLIVFAYAFMIFTSSYLFGRLSDLYGRKVMLVIGLLLAGCTFYLQTFTQGMISLLVVRCLVGRFTSWGSLGWGLITLLAGIVVFLAEIRFVFVLSSVFMFASFVLAMLLPKRAFSSKRVPFFPTSLFLKNIHYYLPYLIRHGLAASIWTFWPLILTNIGAGPLMIGVIQCINAGTQFIVMFFISDRMSPRRLVTIGLIMSAVTFFMMTVSYWTYNLPIMLGTQVLLGVAWGCLYAGTVRYLLENNEEKASSTGLLNSIISTASLIGPILAMVIIYLGGGYLTILVLATIGTLGTEALFLLLVRLKDRGAGHEV